VPPVAGGAAGDALTELLGLNKSLSEGFGDAVRLAAGLAAAEVVAFLRARFGLGDAAGDSAAAAEAAVSAGDAVASDFLCVRCFFAGDSDGDSAGAGD
jgi:threonine/homoserine/homoserine lactone efflux protein